MKQAENSLKCKALLMKITKTASIFSFSVPFEFPRMLIIVLLSVSKRGAVVVSLLETGANCQTGVLKRINKINFCVLSLVFRKN